MTSLLSIIQSIYGNVAQPLAELERVGAERLGWTPAEVRAALEAGRTGPGRLMSRKGRNGRWAVFLKGE